PVFFGYEHIDIAADQCLVAVTKNGAHGPVSREDDPVPVHRDDAIDDVVANSFQPGMTFAQMNLNGLCFGHILMDDDKPHVAVPVEPGDAHHIPAAFGWAVARVFEVKFIFPAGSN